MEKLIKLINEYLKTKDTEIHKTLKVYAFEEATKSFIAENGISYRQERVISKRFEFIKRLIENNKIVFHKVYEKEENENIDICMSGKDADIYWLLMLLSISDSPVEDLISYLK